MELHDKARYAPESRIDRDAVVEFGVQSNRENSSGLDGRERRNSDRLQVVFRNLKQSTAPVDLAHVGDHSDDARFTCSKHALPLEDCADEQLRRRGKLSGVVFQDGNRADLRVIPEPVKRRHRHRARW